LPKAADLLAALQVQHLTRVELHLWFIEPDGSALAMALAQLSNLQQPRLRSLRDASLGAALTTLVQLPQLTLLELAGQWPVTEQVESQQ
jgi:hypothetical protein